MRGANTRFSPALVSQLTEASIDFVSTGDNTLVAGVGGQSVKVYKLFFVASAATTVIFKSGATALTGAITLAAGGSVVLDFDAEPWFTTGTAAAFVLNQSGTAQISGRVYYIQGA